MTKIGRQPICLINPGTYLTQSWVYRNLMFPVPPMNLAYLAGSLEQDGWDSFIIDQFATGISNRDLAHLIRRHNPLFIGVSCLTPAMGSVQELIRECRNAFDVPPPIVFGNTHANVFAKYILKQGLADVVVHGEGERRIVQLARAIESGGGFAGIPDLSYRDGNHVVNTNKGDLVQDLEELAYPLWSKLDFQYYNDYPFLMIREPVLAIQGSRGCPFSCTFCSQDKAYKKPRYRSSEGIIREMEFMLDHYDIRVMGFNDSYFPHAKESGMEFCRLWRDSSLAGKMRWFTETRVDLVDEELIVALKEAGCELIAYGFETGSQKLLDSIGKRATLDQARAAMRAMKKVGMNSIGFFIIGMPGETPETIEQTIRYSLELDPDMAKFNIFIPMPGSPAFHQFWSEEDIATDPERFTSWSLFVGNSHRAPYLPEGMSAAQLASLQKKAMLRFYFRFSKAWRLISARAISLRHMFSGGIVLAWLIVRRLLRKDKA